jgi:hypothetical protein
LNFNVSNESVTEKMIGDIVYENQAVDVKELLVNGETEIIQLNHDVWDILALDRHRIVRSSRDNKCLIMYDENFKPVKIVKKINEVGFDPTGIASYDDHLYITDEQNHRTIKLDFEFKTIKTTGSLGSSSNKFNSPWGICCKNGILYICDTDNQRMECMP